MLAFGDILRRAGASLRRPAQARGGYREASFRLPLESEDITAFARRIDMMLRMPGSFVYIDTSLLMWMIKVGTESRREFANWLQRVCGTRVAVPTWSLHELYRHHTERRLPTDLDEHVKKLNAIVGESFPMFWTFFDEPLGGAPSVEQQRDQARDALRAVKTVTDRVSAWSTNYDRNAREVIELANRYAIKGGEVFEEFATIEDLAAARFTGRIPPGFKDKHKREALSEDGDDETVVGSNRWGDLMFWREVLDHARARKVRNVVILTKDVKNDWRMAGSLPVSPPEAAGPGVQPPHPMLTFEAERTAGVQEVVLLDQGRLAEIMKTAQPGATTNFIAAARPPSLPLPKTEQEIRQEAVERERRDRARVAEGIAKASNFRFTDPQGLNVSAGILRRQIFDTRADQDVPSEVRAIEKGLLSALGDKAMPELLTSELVVKLGGIGLIGIARRLLASAAEDQNHAAAANDLAGALETFPPITASYLYAGLLAGTYLDDMNAFRSSPLGVAAQKLFAAQHLPFAVLPIKDLATRAAKSVRIPLYLPLTERPPIVVEFKIDTDLDRANALRSIRIEDHDLLIDVQADQELKLSDRLRGAPLTKEVALDHVADLYVLPRGQLAAAGNLVGAYSCDEHVGFRPPQDVWRDTSGENEDD